MGHLFLGLSSRVRRMSMDVVWCMFVHCVMFELMWYDPLHAKCMPEPWASDIEALRTSQ